MRFFIGLFILIFMPGCNITKPRWSKELYAQQKKQTLFSAKRNYDLRSKVLRIKLLNRKEPDTFF